MLTLELDSIERAWMCRHCSRWGGCLSGPPPRHCPVCNGVTHVGRRTLGPPLPPQASEFDDQCQLVITASEISYWDSDGVLATGSDGASHQVYRAACAIGDRVRWELERCRHDCDHQFRERHRDCACNGTATVVSIGVEDGSLTYGLRAS